MAKGPLPGKIYVADHGEGEYIVIMQEDAPRVAAWRFINSKIWTHTDAMSWDNYCRSGAKFHPDPDIVLAEYTAWRLLNG
jgi:hypothetical protein